MEINAVPITQPAHPGAPEAESALPRPASQPTRHGKTSRWLPPHEAWRMLCALTGCSVSFSLFEAWMSAGRIKFIWRGRRRYIKTKVVEQLAMKALTGQGW